MKRSGWKTQPRKSDIKFLHLYLYLYVVPSQHWLLHKGLTLVGIARKMKIKNIYAEEENTRRSRAANSVVHGHIWLISNPSNLLWLSSFPASMKRISNIAEKMWWSRFHVESSQKPCRWVASSANCHDSYGAHRFPWYYKQ